MRVLLLGATGNLGSRLLPALIQRGHTVTVFVRDPSRLPAGVDRSLFHVECGDAKKASAIKAAAAKFECEGIVNTAGNLAIAPWGSSGLPAIVDAVIRAALELDQERGRPLRLWVLAGFGMLDVPNTDHMLVDYLHVLTEHRGTLTKLQALPRESALWSLLCPSMMQPLAPPTYPVVQTASGDNLLVAGSVPPQWSEKYQKVPIIGAYLNVFSQATGYTTALEDNADFIASDLLRGTDSPWIYQKVGTKEKQKQNWLSSQLEEREIELELGYNRCTGSSNFC